MFHLYSRYYIIPTHTHTHTRAHVLPTFCLQMSISDGLGSRKLEVLADTAVTLEQSTDGAVTTEVIKKILKVTIKYSYRLAIV